MRIVFLGSSHGIPEANRRCACILVEVGQKRYLFDMGTHAIEQLRSRGCDVESIKGIFITHMHGDHTNGLLSFFDLCSWTFKSADPEVFLPEPVEEASGIIRAWLRCNGVDMRSFRFHGVREGCFFDDGTLKVTAFPTKHIRNAFAFLIEAEGKRVLYTGDLSTNGPQEDFPVQVLDNRVDLLICELAHFDAAGYVPIFRGRDIAHLCVTHYSPKKLQTIPQLTGALPALSWSLASDGREYSL